MPLRPLEAFRRPSDRFVLGWAAASLVANIGIVLTGGAVRLTGSGLGCPTWPRCTADGSFVPHRELGIHGVIEFGNRLLTYVLIAIAVGTLVAVWRHRPARTGPRRLAVVLAAGIPAQALLGGVTVLTGLNPWTVGAHLLVSMVLIATSVVLLHRLREGDGPVLLAVPRPVAMLAGLTYVLLWTTLVVGTIVTGSGPHSGDIEAGRNGLDARVMSQLHADLVFLLVGLSIGGLLALRAVDAPRRAVSAAGWLVLAEAAQGSVGLVQYATDLPVVLVELHLLGASVLTAVATWLMLTLRNRGPVPDRPDGAGSSGFAGVSTPAPRP